MSPNSLSLVAAANAIRDRDITSMELLASCVSAIESYDSTLNAVMRIDKEAASHAAELADKAVKSGAPIGLLHGVPLAHKDMFYQRGRVSSCGSSIRRGWVADTTATVLNRLEDAGSITFAHLSMTEFAHSPTGHNKHYGNCHNPWNTSYVSGGSSSGPGASVAARFTFAALGSDTGGSVRLPASACGVTGFKPTQTRVSRAGVMPLSFSADVVGPLARTARDCARILRIIAGQDLLDPTSSSQPVPDYEAALTGDLRGMRVGLVNNSGLSGKDEEIIASIAEAVLAIGLRGASVTPVHLPYVEPISAYVSIIARCETATAHSRWMRERPKDYAAHLSAGLYAGYAIPATYYIEAISARGAILRSFASEVFDRVDVFILPTIADRLPTLDETDMDSGKTDVAERFASMSSNTRLFNYLGLPAISICCGFDSGGLPIGLQIVGRPFSESRILAVADAYQRDTHWHNMEPSMA